MTVVSMSAPGAAVVGEQIARVAVLSHARVQAITRHHTQLLVGEVKAHASGRPGPNAPTGDYRRSITMSFSSVGGGFQGSVGTDRPQGPRLEYGFHGTDSLGRHYDQPPYPHFDPAFVPRAEAFALSLAAAVTESST